MMGGIVMAQTNVNIRMDDDVKKKADALFAELGINMTTAFNIFVRQAIRAGGLPFEVTTRSNGFYNEFNQQRLKKSIDRLKAGKGTVHDLIETTND